MRNDQPARAGRRSVLAAGAVGVTGALTGCAVYGRQEQPAAPPPAAAPAPSPELTPDAGASAEPGITPEPSLTPDGGAPAGGGGTRVASTGDVAVGGGYISTEHGVVVTQPAGGDFRAFSATCTHQGCPVTSVADGSINCACHGSRFSIQDGSVQGGPAPTALAEVPVTVNGDSIEI